MVLKSKKVYQLALWIMLCMVMILHLAFRDRETKTNKNIQQNGHTSKPMKMTLFLCGDVMTGRGIDQLFTRSVDPVLYESYVKDARDYVKLAEQAHGTLEYPVSHEYIWGDALSVWEETRPDSKIINLETSITTHENPWPRKGINYRMHPDNTAVLTAAGIDYCALANNHTLDWGHQGLKETIGALEHNHIAYSGAGHDLEKAREPAVLENEKGRVTVFSYGSQTSGIPEAWAADHDKSGINLLPGSDKEIINTIKDKAEQIKHKGDIMVCSIHWGSNWGYHIPAWQQELARKLVDEAGIDIVHGHSSHHPKGIEVYNNKLIIYGAGDFINDYEGIGGHEQFRGDLTLMYFPKIDPVTGDLQAMKMVPMQIRKFRLQHVSGTDAGWLKTMLNREGEQFGTSFTLQDDNTLSMHWENLID